MRRDLVYRDVGALTGCRINDLVQQKPIAVIDLAAGEVGLPLAQLIRTGKLRSQINIADSSRHEAQEEEPHTGQGHTQQDRSPPWALAPLARWRRRLNRLDRLRIGVIGSERSTPCRYQTGRLCNPCRCLRTGW